MNKENKLVAFIRPNDGSIFSINENNTTFSLKSSKEQFPDAIHHEYTKECLTSHDFIPVYNYE
jgi:hypothetical protein